MKKIIVCLLVLSVFLSINTVVAFDGDLNNVSHDEVLNSEDTEIIESSSFDDNLGSEELQNVEYDVNQENSRVIYVGQNTTEDGGNGSYKNPFSTLQFACNNVSGEDKSDAIAQLLPFQKEFGNVTVQINVVPANREEYQTIDLINLAFKGNPNLSYIETVDGIFSNKINYVVFKNEVVQYFNDNLNDIHGLTSTLYQDIAKDLFGTNKDVCFCTDVPSDTK